MENTQLKKFYVPLGKFDPNRLVIKVPHVTEFTVNNTPVRNVRSDIRYLNDEGEECELVFAGAPQRTPWGVSVNHPLTLTANEKTPETVIGFQLMYQATSLNTKDSPTPDESSTIKTFENFTNAVIKALEGFYKHDKKIKDNDGEEDECYLPAPSYASITSVMNTPSKKRDWSKALKKIFDYPKMTDPSKPNRKIPDTSKPLRAYFKLDTKGKGENIQCLTKFFLPGNRIVDGSDCIETDGILTPVFMCKHIYYGSHGNQSPVGQSMQFRIFQGNFTPREKTNTYETVNFLGENNDPYTPPKEISETLFSEDSDGSEDDNNEDTISALRAASKK